MSRLNQLKNNLPHDDFYQSPFRITLESCIPLLKTQDATVVDVDPHHARIYEGDFYTYLLTTIQIPKEFHWVIARVNGLLSPSDFTREIKTLIIPSQKLISNMQVSVNTVQTLDDY